MLINCTIHTNFPLGKLYRKATLTYTYESICVYVARFFVQTLSQQKCNPLFIIVKKLRNKLPTTPCQLSLYLFVCIDGLLQEKYVECKSWNNHDYTHIRTYITGTHKTKNVCM